MKIKYFLIGALVTIIFALSAFYAFACDNIQPSITPLFQPTDTPELSPSDVPTEVPVSSALPTPTETQSNNVPSSDHLSDGKSSCPECTMAPQVPIVPSAAPNTGRG